MWTATQPPFTVSQWQELEHQALIFKYLKAGMTVPPELLAPIRKSFQLMPPKYVHHPTRKSRKSPKYFPFLPSYLCASLWNLRFPNVSIADFKFFLHFWFVDFDLKKIKNWQVGYCSYYGKKIDPEPGRCRRTDGKKWRCSRDAHPDSKYCERHMIRRRYRSRKHVESQAAPQSASSVGSDVVAAGSRGDSGSFPSLPLHTNGNREGLNLGNNVTQLQIEPLPSEINKKQYRYMNLSLLLLSATCLSCFCAYSEFCRNFLILLLSLFFSSTMMCLFSNSLSCLQSYLGCLMVTG